MPIKARSAKGYEWRVIPSFPSHEVTEVGEVRRGVSSKTRRAGYMPKIRIDRDGYERVEIKKKPRAIHHLVLDAFVGPRPSPSHMCRHLDGNKRNNAAANLVWGTAAENAADAIRHGVKFGKRGSEHVFALLKEADVVVIRRRRLAGETLSAIARDYGVHFATISYACVRGWRHVA